MVFSFFATMEVKGYRHRSDYQHSLKIYVMLCRRKSYRFGTTWGRVTTTVNIIFVFGWNIPLKYFNRQCKSSDIVILKLKSEATMERNDFASLIEGMEDQADGMYVWTLYLHIHLLCIMYYNKCSLIYDLTWRRTDAGNCTCWSLTV